MRTALNVSRFKFCFVCGLSLVPAYRSTMKTKGKTIASRVMTDPESDAKTFMFSIGRGNVPCITPKIGKIKMSPANRSSPAAPIL